MTTVFTPHYPEAVSTPRPEEASFLSPSQPGAPGSLTLLVHRAEQGLQAVLGKICQRHGLTDPRDWYVLTALSHGVQRTQLELAHLCEIDKTTLTAILDRLEHSGMVVRGPHPSDRRARIPASTPAGRRIQAAVAREHGRIETSLLQGSPGDTAERLRELLSGIAAL